MSKAKVTENIRRKRCEMCGELKPATDFYLDTKTGRKEKICKACSYFVGVENEQKYFDQIAPTDRDSKHRKFCPKCHTWRDTEDFYRDKSKPDGLAVTCSLCIKAKVTTCISSVDRNKNNEKYCFHCNTWKPESDFDANPECKDGLNYYCKRCCEHTIQVGDKLY